MGGCERQKTEGRIEREGYETSTPLPRNKNAVEKRAKQTPIRKRQGAYSLIRSHRRRKQDTRNPCRVVVFAARHRQNSLPTSLHRGVYWFNWTHSVHNLSTNTPQKVKFSVDYFFITHDRTQYTRRPQPHTNHILDITARGTKRAWHLWRTRGMGALNLYHRIS